MRMVAIETSGPAGGIALADSDRLVEEVRLAWGPHQGADLVAAVRGAVDRAGWRPTDVEAVAVSIGPGSFTGLRTAVVFAKMVAHETRARIVAVPTLRALAENAPAGAARVATVLDAKRGGLFASIFERRGADLAETFGPALVEPEALSARLQPPALVLGRGIVKGRAALEGFDLAPEALWDPRAKAVAHLGWAMAKRGEWADALGLAPVYIRPPEAEELWERRQSKV
ncbi:MAG: tRNA (adenosine(37)-N6)-threonylcarbamoyltransferase complex dimerization subunit type 1 TsaB [Phycisphaerae bacterium]